MGAENFEIGLSLEGIGVDLEEVGPNLEEIGTRSGRMPNSPPDEEGTPRAARRGGQKTPMQRINPNLKTIPPLKARRRELRKNLTPAEIVLWHQLQKTATLPEEIPEAVQHRAVCGRFLLPRVQPGH